MDLTRRDLLAGSAAAAAGALAFASLPAIAATMEEAMEAFTGGASVEEGGVDLGAPEIAENGGTVPIEVAAEGAQSITLFASGNPAPEVVTFHFGPLAGESRASTRIRLAKTQDVIAVAKMQDGSFRKASANVKVTIGGCGG